MILVLAFCSTGLAQGQKSASSEGDRTFIDKIQGTWRLVERRVDGKAAQLAGNAAFVVTDNTWLRGDGRFTITEVNDEKNQVVANLSVARGTNEDKHPALVELDGNRLVLAISNHERKSPTREGRGWTREFQSPDDLVPGEGKTIEVWEKLSSTDMRPNLSVRLIDESRPPVTLVDSSLTLRLDGNPTLSRDVDSTVDSVFASGGEGTEIGTRVSASIEDKPDQSIVTVYIYLGREPTGDRPGTRIVRTETVSLKTALKPGEEVRIDCGNNRWCELRLEVPGGD
ncbi:MAG: hypothetical protein U0795_10570 [Pirellulales bacterium]